MTPTEDAEDQGRRVHSRSAEPRSGNALPTDAVVITVAPTGSEPTRRDNPSVPYLPAEIADEAVRAGSAGAGVVHVHVRDDEGRPSAELRRFEEVVSSIHARSGMLCCVSTGGATGMSFEERLAGAHASADAVGVETGSINFAGVPFVTSGSDTARVIEVARSLGKALEVEAFDIGHVAAGADLIDQGVLAVGTPFNLVFGVSGGAPATAGALSSMVSHLPGGSPWTLTAVGRHQTRMLMGALSMGAPGIRVGFEDNVYLRRGVLARSNAELVEQAARLCDLVGRRPPDAEECRAYFKIKPGTAAP
ncbi:MAG: beta-keto acid cleavage family enzyme [Acidimicrobiales bacterium]